MIEEYEHEPTNERYSDWSCFDGTILIQSFIFNKKYNNFSKRKKSYDSSIIL